MDETVSAFAFSWAVLVFDLTIVSWMLWRRSRPFAHATVVVFHVMTAMLFQIGVFPWVMVLTERSGFVDFSVADPATGETWRVRPDAVHAEWQAAQVTRQQWIDPSVDLANLDRSASAADYVLAPEATMDEPKHSLWGPAAIAALLTIVVAGSAVWYRNGRPDPQVSVEPVEISARGPRFDSIDQLFAASDLVLFGEVDEVSAGRTMSDPSDPAAGIRTQLVTFDVERVARGPELGKTGNALVNEQGWAPFSDGLFRPVDPSDPLWRDLTGSTEAGLIERLMP